GEPGAAPGGCERYAHQPPPPLTAWRACAQCDRHHRPRFLACVTRSRWPARRRLRAGEARLAAGEHPPARTAGAAPTSTEHTRRRLRGVAVEGGPKRQRSQTRRSQHGAIGGGLHAPSEAEPPETAAQRPAGYSVVAA